MSPETIHDVYTVAFNSTKEEDSTQTGALGLGSKTPFAYDQEQAIMVTSWFDGIKTAYTVFMDKGIPKILKLSECESDEHTGVEIVVPVHEEDFDAFKDAVVKSTYTMKNPSPSFNMDIELPKPVISTNEYSLYSGNRRIVAEMCNVVYPIKKSELKNHEDYDTLYSMLSYGSNSQYCMTHFDSGELDFQASREELFYDNYYVNVIEDKLQHIVSLFIKNIQNEIDTQHFSDWREMYTYCVSLKLSKNVIDRLKFNGVTLETYKEDLERQLVDICTELYSMKETAIQYEKKANRVSRTIWRRHRFGNESNSYNMMYHLPSPSLGRINNFFINDLGNKGKKFIRPYMIENQLHKIWYIDEGAESSRTEFCKILMKLLHPNEIGHAVKASEVESMNLNLTTKPVSRCKPVEVFEYVNGSRYSTNVDVEFLKTGTYYYTGYYNQYCDNNGVRLTSTFKTPRYVDNELLQFIAKQFGCDKIYAIRRSKLKLAEENKNAICISDPSIVDKFYKSIDIRHLAISRISNIYNNKTYKYCSVKDGNITQYSKLISDALMRNDEIRTKVNDKILELDTERDEHHARYPLYELCLDKKSADEYVKLVDFYNNNKDRK